jgi:hypothetical protein
MALNYQPSGIAWDFEEGMTMELAIEKIETDELDAAQVDAMIVELQGETPLSQLSTADARKVFNRMQALGYLIGKAVWCRTVGLICCWLRGGGRRRQLAMQRWLLHSLPALWPAGQSGQCLTGPI